MADSTEPEKETVPAKPATSVTATPAAQERLAQAWVDQVPMPLCWALVVISATVLILQIWNYLS